MKFHIKKITVDDFNCVNTIIKRLKLHVYQMHFWVEEVSPNGIDHWTDIKPIWL